VEARTHLAIDQQWCGTPVALDEGTAEVELLTVPAMAADAQGLVHGGFVFGLADHAAMLAVNDPLVVLARAEVDFLRPVRVGERLHASAAVTGGEGKRREVECTVRGPAGEVMRGRFACVIPRRHVLSPREEEESPRALRQGGGG
jgi:uncharacterized protein (TIGR00369 family)